MIDISKILIQTNNPKLVDFSNFLVEQTGDKSFANYKQLNLMLIPRIVPHIWVLDFRGGLSGGVPLHYSGTYIDSHFGRNITGLTVGEHYQGHDYETVVENLYFKVFSDKKIAYAKRRVHFIDDFVDRVNMTESILFPCSHNNQDIDYAIGVSEYFFDVAPLKDKYALF